MPVDSSIDSLVKNNEELAAKARQSLETAQQEWSGAFGAVAEFLEGAQQANLRLSERLLNYSFGRVETLLPLGSNWLARSPSAEAGPIDEPLQALDRMMEADRALYRDLGDWWDGGIRRSIDLARRLSDAQRLSAQAGLAFFESVPSYGEQILRECQNFWSEPLHASVSGNGRREKI